MKRTLLFLMALIMSAGFAFAATTIPASNNVPGVEIADIAINPTGGWSGANIILGNDATVWPWSTAGDDGAVAFTPVAGATYHMTFTVTTTASVPSMRVRWISGTGNGGYTTADAANPGLYTVTTADETAPGVPAWFNYSVASGVVQTYTVDFTMDGSQPAAGLIGNLGIRGGSGSNDFVVNTIVITDDAGNQLVNYDKDAKTVLTPSSNVPGVEIADIAIDPTGGWSGANIILGNDATVWPWSTAGDDGAVAFTPVADATYHMTFTVTTTASVPSMRVRWISGTGNGGYTSADAANPGLYTVTTADETAPGVPAWFNYSVASGVVQTYTVDFTMDGSQPAAGLIGNLGIRGGSGSNDFVVNTIVITDDAGNQLVNYDKDVTGIIAVKSAVSNAYGVTGGIKVNGINENVSIYSIDGSLVKQAIANQGTTIPVQQGLYIVKVGANNAVKVLVK